MGRVRPILALPSKSFAGRKHTGRGARMPTMDRGLRVLTITSTCGRKSAGGPFLVRLVALKQFTAFGGKRPLRKSRASNADKGARQVVKPVYRDVLRRGAIPRVPRFTTGASRVAKQTDRLRLPFDSRQDTQQHIKNGRFCDTSLGPLHAWRD
jgi:hypothetical protein